MPSTPKPIKKRPSRLAKKGGDTSLQIEGHKAAKKRETAITIGALSLAAIIIIIIAVFLFAFLPLQRVLLSVGKENVSYDYFIKRMAAIGTQDVSTMEQTLTSEIIIEQQGPSAGLTAVSNADIDTYLRNLAKGTSDSISDADYATWLKQKIQKSGLSKAEFMDVAKRDVERTRLADVLSANVDKNGPQVHLWAMFFSSLNEATQAKARLEAGEPWSTVVTSSNSPSNGGDYSWTPFGILDAQLEPTLEQLEPGVYSDPVAYYQSSSSSSSGYSVSYVILMISEKINSMAMTDSQYTALQSNNISEWLSTQSNSYKITVHGLHGATSMDTATTNWIVAKAQKLITAHAPKTTTSTTTSSTTTSSSTSTSSTTTTSTTTTQAESTSTTTTTP